MEQKKTVVDRHFGAIDLNRNLLAVLADQEVAWAGSRRGGVAGAEGEQRQKRVGAESAQVESPVACQGIERLIRCLDPPFSSLRSVGSLKTSMRSARRRRAASIADSYQAVSCPALNNLSQMRVERNR